MKFQPNNPIRPGSDAYIRREADRVLPWHLQEGHSCNVRAGRLAGKTSLMFAARDKLTGAGHRLTRIVLYDYRQSTLLEAWKAAARKILLGAGIMTENEHSPLAECTTIERTTSRLAEFLQKAADGLSREQRLYVLVDETDSFLRYPVDEVDEFLSALRSVVQDDLTHRIPWLFASLRPLVWMADSRKTGGVTPNIAVDVRLDPFPNTRETWDQICTLGFQGENRKELYPVVEEVLNLTGGHAQLTSAVLCELQMRSDVNDRREAFAKISAELIGGGPCLVDNHLHGIAQQLLCEPDQTVLLLNAWERVLEGEHVPTADGGTSFDSLANIGLLKIEDGYYRIANPIYEAHLRAGWLRDIQQRHQVSRDRPVGGFHPTGPRARIAVLSVGGTVAMITTPGGESTFQGADDYLLEAVEKALHPIAEARWIPFEHLDGINVTPRDWSRIATWIHESQDRFDGFVVAHGTDTLASAASGVAFMLGRSMAKPVVFTGSQATISVPHGDALDNLGRACFVAAHPQAPGEVQVHFGNQVLRAVRAEKADDRLFQGFRSTGWPELAQVSEKLLINPYALAGRGAKDTDCGFQPYFASNILVIYIVPGLPVRFFEPVFSESALSEGIDGLIVHTPGAGNIPYRDEHNFRDFIKRAVDAGMPVLVTSQVPINPYTQPQYEMSRAVTDYGAILAGNMTFPAAHAKFVWVIGCVNHEDSWYGETRMAQIKTRMHHNYQGEQSDPEGYAGALEGVSTSHESSSGGTYDSQLS